MPRKIKKYENISFKRNDEKILRVDNVNYFVFLAVIILVLICACVGGYVYSRDKYLIHKDVAFYDFEYTEKVDDGYIVYQVALDENKNVYAYYNTPDGITVQKKWSYSKYLNFNEELYLSWIFENIFDDVEIDDEDVKWMLDAKLITGETVHNSSNFEEQVDKNKFREVIKKYFGKEIIYN